MRDPGTPTSSSALLRLADEDFGVPGYALSSHPMRPDADGLSLAEPVSRSLARRSAGDGDVELAVVNGRTTVVRLRAESPLRLLSPRSRADAAWVVAGSYGGGLVSGDWLSFTMRCRAGTRTVLGTQATTKVYRSRIGRANGPVAASCQELSADVADGATLVSWPDPVTCFAGSRFVQRQTFRLSATASLAAIDWVTSGRMARGERWAFDRYTSETQIHVDGRLRLRESTTLDPADGAMTAIARTDGMDCLGMAWLVGPAFTGVCDDLIRRLERDPIDPRRSVQFAVSRVGQAGDGAVIRFASRGTDAGWAWLRLQLRGVLDVVGIDPWSRRG